MHYFISAGEASGDLHAAELIRELKRADNDARFSFLGGDLMAEAAQCSPIIHYREMAFMGFSEVLRNIFKILGNLRRSTDALKASNADALILVDYPSFNLKLAKKAVEHGIPVYYFIPPKVWAWKEYRVKTMRKLIRKIFAIFPFEPDFYSRHGMNVAYVGNPSVEETKRQIENAPSRADFLAKHSLSPDKPILALVPGSRRGEIRCNLPIMEQVAARYPDMQPVIAAAPGIDKSLYKQYSSAKTVDSATLPLMIHAEAALVTSGTATLECALASTPQIVCYRANGSKLSYNIMKRILKIPFVSLPNLIAAREVIPEMLVHLCTPEAISSKLDDILPGAAGRQMQLDGYKLIRQRLGDGNAAVNTARAIVDDLQNQPHQPKTR